MKAAHTPGPWEYSTAAHDKHGVFGPIQSEADARLIAAAPELLEAALLFAAYEDAIERGDDIEGMRLYSEASKKARSAIKKAQGDS